MLLPTVMTAETIVLLPKVMTAETIVKPLVTMSRTSMDAAIIILSTPLKLAMKSKNASVTQNQLSLTLTIASKNSVIKMMREITEWDQNNCSDKTKKMFDLI